MLLLTGAAGFIGSNVLATLNRQGRDDVICVDDLTDGRKCLNLAGKKFADYFDYRDIFPPQFARLSGIIHLGADSRTGATDGREIIQNNFAFTKRLFLLAEQHDCPIVYASSASVYGTGLRGFQEIPECEKPMSPYAVSKWMIDQYVRQSIEGRHRRFSVPITGLRYFNVYGPGESHKDAYASFAHKLYTAAVADSSVDLFVNSHEIRRDFIYVQDAADITLFFLEAKAPGIYNVGTGTARSFEEMLNTGMELIQEYMPTPTVHSIPMPNEFVTRYQSYTQADITRLRVAGWNNKFTTLEKGMWQFWNVFKQGATNVSQPN